MRGDLFASEVIRFLTEKAHDRFAEPKPIDVEKQKAEQEREAAFRASLERLRELFRAADAVVEKPAKYISVSMTEGEVVGIEKTDALDRLVESGKD